METVETFADKAKRLLKQSGLTYQQAGERMGFPHAEARQAVYRFINGKNPSAAMVVKFAKALGVTVEEVM